MTPDPKPGWWKSFYDDTPFDNYLLRTDPQELAETLDFLTAELHLLPGNTVFDQCCGAGGMSIPLLQRGMRVTGVDLCERFIETATDLGKTHGEAASFHVGDAFSFVPTEACDAAINWYTSFGYSDRDEQNKLMLRCAFNALKPGKHFALEYPNMAYILNNFKPRIQHQVPHEVGSLTITRQCQIDLAHGLMKQSWEFAPSQGEPVTRDSSLRIYLPHNIADMLRAVGFEDVHMYGGHSDTPLKLDSARAIWVARRPS